MPRRFRLVITLVAAAALAACAQSGRRGESRFPQPQELEELREAAPPEDPFPAETMAVPSWALEAPLGERVDATQRSPVTSWEVLLDEAVRRRQGLALATDEMHCVARELGRFYLTFRQHPSESLRRFVVARCGVPAADLQFGYVQLEGHSPLPEEELFAQWRAMLSETIETQLMGGPRFVGIWFGRSEERAVAMVASSRRSVRLDPVATVLRDDRHVVLRGEALIPVAEMDAIINRGSYQVAECARNPAISLPRFEFECEAAADDTRAWVSVTLLPPGRWFAQVALEVLLRAPGEPLDVYVRPATIDSVPVSDPSRVPDQMTALLNRVRKEAGLAPLRLAMEQSETAADLAPHFFSALLDHKNAAVADLVMLGMMAGWQVDGIVQRGHVSSAWITASDDAARLLAEALDQPVGRFTLLDPDCEQIAIGAMLGEDNGNRGIAALFATYAMFSPESHAALQREVLERFTRARAERGLGPPDRLDEIEELAIRAASRVEGGDSPKSALNSLLRRSSDVLHRPVNGWIMEVSDLDQLEFPDDFLNRPRLGLAVGVSYHRPKSEPWGRYTVMLVAAEPERRVAAF